MSDTDDQRGQGHEDPTAPPAQDPLSAPPSPYQPTEPIPQTPSSDPPAHGRPGDEQPTDQPAYGRPAYGQPSYGQPSYGQPSYGQQAAPEQQPWGLPPTPPVPPTGPTQATQPGADPYAQPTAAYGQPYGQSYGQSYGQPPAYAQPFPGTYTQPANNGSALALTIVSAVSVVMCGGLLVIPALIFGIVGLTKQSSDPEGSRRMSRYGWWAFGIGVVVSILLVVGLFAFLIAAEGSGSFSYDGY
jgi:hypothetical protein